MTNDFIFPRLAHDDTFEDIVCDIQARQWNNPNIQRYGRKGQKQNGIDLVGMAGKDYVHNELIGGQCKNHVVPISDAKLQTEVDEEVANADQGNLPLDRFLFFTSASNSASVKDYVIKLSESRVKEGKFPVEILFWDYITGKLTEYPDLLYKYYTHMLPTQKTEDLMIPDLHKKTRQTLSVNAESLTDEASIKIKEELVEITNDNMNGLQKGQKYNLYIGLSTKKDISFSGLVDIDINCSHLFADENALEEKFAWTKSILNRLLTVITDTSFSKNLVLYTDIEISLAVLLGKLLRKHKFDARIVFKKQIWTVNQDDLPYVPGDIFEKIPQVNDVSNNDAVFIFDAINRDSAENDVIAYIDSKMEKPRVIVSYRTVTQISNSAHALSIAKSIVKKIHMLESWKIKRIHLFLIVPKPLAFLIGYHLNTLNSSIYLYFMDETRSKYLLAGTVDNKTF